MKKIWFLIAIFFISSQLNGQRINHLDNMIISSLNSFIAESNDNVRRGIVRADTTYYYVCTDGLPALFPYDSLKNVAFFSLQNLEGLPNSFKRKLNKGINALFVNIRLTNNQLIITVSDNSVRRIKKNHIGIATGFHFGFFTYEYSCDKQEWKLQETKFGGI
jgi:hypothetical protein